MGQRVQTTNIDPADLDPTWGERDTGEQIPLVLRWETRAHWIALRELIGLNENESAIALALADNAASGRWTSYSRTRAHYNGRDSALYGYTRVVGGADGLIERGLVESFTQERGRRDWQSAMRATTELLAAVAAAAARVGRPVPLRPASPVVLRDAAGNVLDLPDTRETRRMIREVEEINEALRHADISTGSACLRRIFNGDVTRGGRWYAIGAAWQAMPEAERANILIDGRPVVEVDYKTYHPGMLYSEAGLPVPEDCYDANGYDRDLVKAAFLVLVNARTAMQAIKSIAGKKEMAAAAEPGSDDAERVAADLVRWIRDRHEAIASAFGSDAGARLMRRDSDIAGDVLRDMRKAGVTCLPVHDSFIVRSDAKDVLEEAMKRAACVAGLHNIRLETTPATAAKLEGWIQGKSTACEEPHPTYAPSSLPSLPPFLGDSEKESVLQERTSAVESLTPVVQVATPIVVPPSLLEGSRPERSVGRGGPGSAAPSVPSNPFWDGSEGASDVIPAATPTPAELAPYVDPGSSQPHSAVMQIEAPPLVPIAASLTTVHEPITVVSDLAPSKDAISHESSSSVDPGASQPASRPDIAGAIAALKPDPSAYGRRLTLRLVSGATADSWRAPGSANTIVRLSCLGIPTVRRFDDASAAAAYVRALAAGQGGVAETVYSGPWLPGASLEENRRLADERSAESLRRLRAHSGGEDPEVAAVRAAFGHRYPAWHRRTAPAAAAETA